MKKTNLVEIMSMRRVNPLLRQQFLLAADLLMIVVSILAAYISF